MTRLHRVKKKNKKMRFAPSISFSLHTKKFLFSYGKNLLKYVYIDII